jgi:hypothetical protein
VAWSGKKIIFLSIYREGKNVQVNRHKGVGWGITFPGIACCANTTCMTRLRGDRNCCQDDGDPRTFKMLPKPPSPPPLKGSSWAASLASLATPNK